jgi:hypothetical protein
MKEKDDCIEAHRAIQQAHSLIEVSQETFIGPESEDIFNLLDILDEKIKIVLNFFDDSDPCLKLFSKKEGDHESATRL